MGHESLSVRAVGKVAAQSHNISQIWAQNRPREASMLSFVSVLEPRRAYFKELWARRLDSCG